MLCLVRFRGVYIKLNPQKAILGTSYYKSWWEKRRERKAQTQTLWIEVDREEGTSLQSSTNSLIQRSVEMIEVSNSSADINRALASHGSPSIKTAGTGLLHLRVAVNFKESFFLVSAAINWLLFYLEKIERNQKALLQTWQAVLLDGSRPIHSWLSHIDAQHKYKRASVKVPGSGRLYKDMDCY